jgi:excisionase family DNA binding protein
MPETDSLSHIAHMDVTPPEPSLRTAEVARALGVSARAVRTWADEGKISCWRTFGGHRLFAVSEVCRVLASWGRSGMAAVAGDEAPLVPASEPPGVAGPLTVAEAAMDEERGSARG